MAYKHEVKRLEADLELDESLKTEAGRTLRWQELGSQAAKDSLIELFIRTFDLKGDVIECGVYRGGSLFKLLWAMKQHGIQRTVWACDSFEGFPSDSIKSVDSTLFRPVSKLQQKFKLAHDVPARIERFAQMYDTPVQVVKGYFSDTLPKLPSTPLAFIHLDVDIYESYRECLQRLYPLLVPGGIVVFDDYGSPKWPGAKRAVDEFFAGTGQKVELATTRENPAWYVQRR